MERVSGSNALQIQPAARPAPEGVFYRLDSTRASWREYWWGNRSPRVLIAWLLKLLRVQLPGSTDDPPVESLKPFQVDEAALPAEVRAQLAPLLAELRTDGFATPVFHVIDDVLHRTRTYLATTVHASRLAIGRVHLRQWSFPQPPKITLFTELISELNDGTFVWTLSSRPDTIEPPCCAVEHRVGVAPADLWTLHCARLVRAEQRAAAVPVADVAELAERHHAAVRDFHLARGFFAPLRDTDRERTARDAGNREVLETAGLRHAEVLAEIDALQRGTVSWSSGVLTLLVSLVLFLGAGAAARWTVTLMLVPVLLFHELGHYVAMRAFRYRNLRMFFIPFFGAAVSGRNYNVAGWKRAVVSMMGPVPGIVAGGLIGLIGPVLGWAWARETALMLLVLNGINLLPLLPLDGGWVVHTLLFSRHHRLDGLFQIAAAAVLAVGGIGFGDPVLGLLAVMLLAGARTSYRLARIAYELRRDGVSAISPDDQSIPPPVAQTIIDRLAAVFPTSNARSLAQHTLQVFGTINARPPAWPAALGLGAVYVGSLLAAVALTAAVAIGPTELAAVVHRNLPPKWSLDAGAVRVTERASFPAATGRTVVATFASPAAARDAFVAAQARRPTGAGAALFGQSLLLSSADDAALAGPWSDAATRGAATMLIGSSTQPIDLTMSCTAESDEAAESLAHALQSYFLLPTAMHLIPPWASPDARPEWERARHERARATFLQLEAAGGEVYGDPRWREAMRQVRVAREAGDQAGIDARRADGRQLVQAARVSGVAALRDRAAGGQLDRELIDRYADQLVAAGPAARELDLAPLAPYLGSLAPGPMNQFAAAGSAWSGGRRVRVEGARFEDLFHGPTALAAWLRANGCAAPRYQFEAGASDD